MHMNIRVGGWIAHVKEDDLVVLLLRAGMRAA